MSETPTRELEHPQTEVEGGKVEWNKNYYKITEKQEETREELEDFWAELDPDGYTGPPVTLYDKQTRPFERNYPTAEQLKDIQGK